MFESDTVKSDCPVQIFRKIQYRVVVFWLLFFVPDPKSDFFPINQLIKKIWPYTQQAKANRAD